MARKKNPVDKPARGRKRTKASDRHRGREHGEQMTEAQPPPKRDEGREDKVVEASEESFPASDPPSWTPNTGI